MVATQDTLSSRLQGFNHEYGARGSAVVTRDGLPLVSELPPSVNVETFAAMTATMMGAADTAAAQVTEQTAQRVQVDYDGWHLISFGAGPDVLLVVLADGRAPLGPLEQAARGLAAELRKTF